MSGGAADITPDRFVGEVWSFGEMVNLGLHYSFHPFPPKKLQWETMGLVFRNYCLKRFKDSERGFWGA